MYLIVTLNYRITVTSNILEFYANEDQNLILRLEELVNHCINGFYILRILKIVNKTDIMFDDPLHPNSCTIGLIFEALVQRYRNNDIVVTRIKKSNDEAIYGNSLNGSANILIFNSINIFKPESVILTIAEKTASGPLGSLIIKGKIYDPKKIYYAEIGQTVVKEQVPMSEVLEGIPTMKSLIDCIKLTIPLAANGPIEAVIKDPVKSSSFIWDNFTGKGYIIFSADIRLGQITFSDTINDSISYVPISPGINRALEHALMLLETLAELKDIELSTYLKYTQL
jgi:hypothetical protein